MKQTPLRKRSPRKAETDRLDAADKKLLMGMVFPKCAICGGIHDLHLHHIFGKKAFPHLRHYRPNHMLLCPRHHFLIHDKPAVGKLLSIGVIRFEAWQELERLANQRKSDRNLAFLLL